MSALDDLKAAINPDSRTSSEGTKTNWLSLEDGEAVDLVFLQELDEAADNYDAQRGTGKVVNEIVSPWSWATKKFIRKALDTNPSWGWEQWRRYKDTDKVLAGQFRPKQRAYINVLAQRSGDAEPQVYLWSFGASPRSTLAPEIAEIAQENGTITDRVFVLKRRGKGTDTTYSFKEAKGDKSNLLEASANADLELIDLTNIPQVVPYEEMESYFAQDAPDAVAVASAPVTDDDAW